MEVAGETTISLGDVVGPFHPYVEVEGEEELNGCSEGHSGNDGVEVKIDVIGDLVAVEEPRVLVVAPGGTGCPFGTSCILQGREDSTGDLF